MGFLDKVKAQAEQAVKQGQDMLEDAQAKKKADGLLRDLGAWHYAIETGRDDGKGEAEMARIIGELHAHEALYGPLGAKEQAPPPPPGAPPAPGAPTPAASPPPPVNAPPPPVSPPPPPASSPPPPVSSPPPPVSSPPPPVDTPPPPPPPTAPGAPPPPGAPPAGSPF